MKILSKMNQMARSIGYEVVRYDAGHSSAARLYSLLKDQGIDAILDVGANNGAYGRELRQGGYHGKVLSFEPLTQAHGNLKNIAASDSNWFIADRMALGDESGEVEINISENLVSSSILDMNSRHEQSAQESRYTAKEKTPLNRLDQVDLSALGDVKKLFLKIDTQGFEMPVLKGAEGILENIHGIQVELSLVELYDGQMLYRDIIEWLAERGFHLWNMIPGFSDPESGQMLQMDGVFFRS